MNSQDKDRPSLFAQEVTLAVRNGTKLFASLAVTLGVAFVVRFWVPRFLGPESFGIIHFATEFSMFLVFLVSFGANSYIRKEVAARPEHASEFFGSLLLYRAGATLIVFVAFAFVLLAMGKSTLVWYAVYIFLFAQLVIITNLSLNALLEAHGTVNAVVVTQAGMKILWGVAIVVGLLLGYGVLVLPIALLITELFKTPILFKAARKHLNLKLNYSMLAVKAIVIASLPYWLNEVTLGIYTKIGVVILSGMAGDTEVGWYGAVQNLTGIPMLFMPVLLAVIMPMGARLAKESTDLHIKSMVSSTKLMMIASVTLAALLGFNAKDIIQILYTDEYSPSVIVLQIMCPVLPLTFLNAIGSVFLIQVGQIWKLVRVHAVAAVLGLVMKIGLIKGIELHFGQGFAAIALASSDVLTETVVALGLYAYVRPQLTKDHKKQLGMTALRLLVVCAVIGTIHHFISALSYGRIAVDVALWAVVAYPLRVLPIHEVKIAVQSMLERRRNE